MLTLSINSIGVPGWDIHRLIQYAADNGVPYVEIRGLENQLDLLALPCLSDAASVAQIAQALKAKQVKLLSLDLSHRVWDYSPAQDDELRRLADLADRLEASYLRFFPGGKVQDQADVKRLTDNASAIVRLLAGYRVEPLVETHDSLVKLDLLLAMQQAMDKPVGLLWDVVNMMNQGGADWRQTYAAIRPWIRYLHVKDSVIRDGKIEYRLMFEGELPMRELFEHLRAQPEMVVVSLEWEKLWHPELADGELAFGDFVRKMRAL
jgi:sugar phosphate isomerase/epimerase